MAHSFDEFFKKDLYLLLKNNLFNFLRRKDEIHQWLRNGPSGQWIEIGSGISPISRAPSTVYCDLSEKAMKWLKEERPKARVCVMRAEELAFQDGCATSVVCSEVLEHLENDCAALQEIARILRRGGQLLVTVPMHRFYFTFDDHYVGHKRRYELDEFDEALKGAGLECLHRVKVSGPFEKLLTLASVWCFSKLARKNRERKTEGPLWHPAFFWFYRFLNQILAFLVFLDAKVMPIQLSSVVLFDCTKR